jgi:LAO/AO transport system kinase
MNEKTIIENIQKGDTLALSKAITLCESTLENEQKIAQNIIAALSEKNGKSIRVGVTGVPGVGKSTLIETFGKLLTSQGKKVAVLAIDPTSEQTQGSILGDKSRMHELAANKNAFIRPSPSSGTLGGVANKTRESVILCEAAGYDVILVETVGVGQSETTVSNLVDFFLLLMLAGAGDELQGIKRGIMELADGLIINKADGDNITNAKNAALAYKRALHLFPAMENGWTPQVSTCSAIENTGIDKIWDMITTYDSQMNASGWKNENRKKQNIYWLHHIVKEELGSKQYNSLKAEGKLKMLEKELTKGKTIYQLLNSF